MAQLPQALLNGMESLLRGHAQGALTADAQAVSARYRTQTGRGARLLTTPGEAAAYAASRMPATWAAAQRALQLSAACLPGFAPRALLDAGAGTGAAAWAACGVFPTIERAALLEREAAMRAAGQALAQAGPEALRAASWTAADLADPALTLPALGGGPALATACYVLGELTEAQQDAILPRLYAAADALLLVEPGTPAGFARLGRARAQLAALGAQVAAPCPGDSLCPGGCLCAMEGDAWCRFAVRVERTRLHRALKGGEAPFEDETFCFLTVARAGAAPAPARVLRHPQAMKGHVALALCTPQGLRRRVVGRSERAAYRLARDAFAGAAWTEPDE